MAMSEDAERGYPRKRAQTRTRLRRAGLRVLADHGPTGATVGEIAAAAEVAPGTFYNHFPSLGEFIDELADELGTGVEIGQEALAEVESDPAARVAIGVLQLLALAEEDPVGAGAFIRLVAARPSFRGRVRAIVARAITDGVEVGRFGIEAGPVATDAVLGTVLQSMRSIVAGDTDPASAPVVAMLALRVLGLADDDSAQVIPRAEAVVRIPAPAG